MTKILRTQQKIFGQNAGSRQITAFGTAKTETPVYTTDVGTIQNDNYMYGWQPALLPDKAPYEEDMNALFYAVTSQLAYLYQEGIPEYDVNTEYSNTAYVKSTDGTTIYRSLVPENLGNPLNNPDYWQVFLSSGSFENVTQEIENLKNYVDAQNATTKQYIDAQIAILRNLITSTSSQIINANGATACKIGNFTIQWGQTTVSNGQTQTVLLATPFNNTNYKICTQMMNQGIRNAYSNTQIAIIGNLTSFNIAPNFGESRLINWIAVGT